MVIGKAPPKNASTRIQNPRRALTPIARRRLLRRKRDLGKKGEMVVFFYRIHPFSSATKIRAEARSGEREEICESPLLKQKLHVRMLGRYGEYWQKFRASLSPEHYVTCTTSSRRNPFCRERRIYRVAFFLLRVRSRDAGGSGEKSSASPCSGNMSYARRNFGEGSGGNSVRGSVVGIRLGIIYGSKGRQWQICGEPYPRGNLRVVPCC